MAEIVVDVAALADQVLAQSAPKKKPRMVSAAQMAVIEEKTGEALAPVCPLGHAQPEGTRFCGECGMSMTADIATKKVDLEAVREAVLPGSMLDAEKRAERDRQHAEALAANLRAEQSVVDISEQPDPSERKVLIHFVADGFTWAGRVWTEGEMIEIGPQHPRWDTARLWITLTKTEQVQRYGRVFFDFGPYPGAQLRPGQEMLLPVAHQSQWSRLRGGGVPAAASPDGDGSLIPR